MSIKYIIKRILYRIRGDHTTEQLIKMGMTVGCNFKRLNGVILDPSHCWLINIGNNVTMAPRVHILAHDASTCSFLGYAVIGKVNIGDNVFIGAETVVLPNTTIGDNVVVGANSTVTNDLPSCGVYVGSPARYICSIDEFKDKYRYLYEKCPKYGEEYTTRKNVSNEKKKQMIKELENTIGFVI